MSRAKRQETLVLTHLTERGTLTHNQANSLYRISRLSAVIFRLRRNHNIRTIMRYGHNEYGEYIQYAEYKLEEPLPTAIGNDSKGGDNVTDSTSEITT